MKKLNNIDFLIFDLGNVIINIDYDLSINELKKKLPKPLHDKIEDFYASPFLKSYEKGEITSSEFRNEVNKLYSQNWSNEQIDAIWNKLLLDVPQERIELLKELNKHFGTAILSNTNEIHIEAFEKILQQTTTEKSIFDLADKVYLSHKINLVKPDPQIYKTVAADLGTEPQRILFFDDMKANIVAAQEVGYNAVHITHPKGLDEFFEDVQY